MAAEISRPGGGRNGGPSVIFRSEIRPVLHGSMLMLLLRRQRGGMLLAGEGLFLRSRTHVYSACPTVVGNRRSVVDDHRLVVDVGHIRDADVRDGAVVKKRAPAPLPADKANTGVAKSVVNPAVEADVRAPVSRMPGIQSAAPSPVSRRPKQANGRNHPSAGHPVIAICIVPSPIAGRPEVARTGADGLRIDRQRGRSKADGNTNRYLSK